MIDEQERAQALDGLHQRMRLCCLCLESGYAHHPRAIFSGDIPARILLVGQAPGITETWFRLTQYMYCLTQSALRFNPDPSFSANQYSPT
jgi:hypothetical protein